jgi:UDP-N-acetyl-D-mannosaminuronate dehydrogenase
MTVDVAITGLGHVGLPLAAAATRAGSTRADHLARRAQHFFNTRGVTSGEVSQRL